MKDRKNVFIRFLNRIMINNINLINHDHTTRTVLFNKIMNKYYVIAHNM